LPEGEARTVRVNLRLNVHEFDLVQWLALGRGVSVSALLRDVGVREALMMWGDRVTNVEGDR